MRHLTLTAAAAVALLLTAPAARAETKTYELDQTHVHVSYAVKHMGFSISRGSFDKAEATLTIDPAKLEETKIEATLDAKSLDSGLDKRDEHLKKADFFNVEKYPTLKFVSTKVEKTGENTARLTGDLTILDTTKPVTFDVTLLGQGEHPFNKKHTLGFAAKAQIKRSEWGLKAYLDKLASGQPAVGDDVEITIDAEFNQK